MLVDLALVANGLTTQQYALTDGVVVWRAWVICRDESRKLLIAAKVMLVLSMRTSPYSYRRLSATKAPSQWAWQQPLASEHS
jgi:hypothetical protein